MENSAIIEPAALTPAIRARLAAGKRIKISKKSEMRGKRVRVGPQREILASFIAAHCRQFPTEVRLILAAQNAALPSRHCDCPTCAGKQQGWPAGYVWTSRGVGHGYSYECGLHRQSKWFLRNLPSSSSVARFE